MPVTVLNVLHVSAPLILGKALLGRHYYYPMEDVETKPGKV